MDHTIAGRSDTPPFAHKVRQGLVRLDIHLLWIGGGVTERLHHQIGGKAQTGKVFSSSRVIGPLVSENRWR